MGGQRSERLGFALGTHVLLPLMFFVSGFCGLLYQTVWMRLAFARFGVITPVVSVVVSVFMLGLGLGSWIGGKYVGVLSDRLRAHAIWLYGAVELAIGLGAFAVPALFAASSHLLVGLGETNSWPYLAMSGLCMFLSILPFSCAMGVTYPTALRFMEQLPAAGRHRFGRLYAFNTAGAVAGVLVTVYALIELLGMRSVLRVGFFGNLAIAVIAALWGSRLERPSPHLEEAPTSLPADLDGESAQSAARSTPDGEPAQSAARSTPDGEPAQSAARSTPGGESAQSAARSILGVAMPRGDLVILFVTGFCSMAMEVGWVRSFTPVLEHAVYAFAFLLAAYLAGHALGATAHAVTAARGASPAKEILVGATLITATLPIIFANWEWAPTEGGRTTIGLGIGAFAAMLGWLTPMLIDEISSGQPRHAGIAYAVNIAGCMLGPLVMGYAILPILGPRVGLTLLCVPLALLLALSRKQIVLKGASLAAAGAILVTALVGRSFEEGPPLLPREQHAIYRDYTATTIARDLDGVKSLFVNGFPMTSLSPITKMMAHLPFALHGSAPRKVLVICLGMGTTFRAALSWKADVTVVELVPGVARALRNFDDDTDPARRTTSGHIVIDDGRRFLARSTEKFDIIIIDPPPPPEQPASSLLYSVEFYDLLKQHLKPDGIVQQWWGFPFDEPFTMQAMFRSVRESFPYVRTFRAVDDPAQKIFGFHFICSLAPVPPMTAAEFLARLPEGARSDLQEWSVTKDREREMRDRIGQQIRLEVPIERLLLDGARVMITDDAPINEYFYVRRGGWGTGLLADRATRNGGISPGSLRLR